VPLAYSVTCGLPATATYGGDYENGWLWTQSGSISATMSVTNGGTLNGSVEYQISPYVAIVGYTWFGITDYINVTSPT